MLFSTDVALPVTTDVARHEVQIGIQRIRKRPGIRLTNRQILKGLPCRLHEGGRMRLPHSEGTVGDILIRLSDVTCGKESSPFALRTSGVFCFLSRW